MKWKRLKKSVITIILITVLSFGNPPISNTIDRRVIYSPSYNEVCDWVDGNLKTYANIEHVDYVDGKVR